MIRQRETAIQHVPDIPGGELLQGGFCPADRRTGGIHPRFLQMAQHVCRLRKIKPLALLPETKDFELPGQRAGIFPVRQVFQSVGGKRTQLRHIPGPEGTENQQPAGFQMSRQFPESLAGTGKPLESGSGNHQIECPRHLPFLNIPRQTTSSGNPAPSGGFMTHLLHQIIHIQSIRLHNLPHTPGKQSRPAADFEHPLRRII